MKNEGESVSLQVCEANANVLAFTMGYMLYADEPCVNKKVAILPCVPIENHCHDLLEFENIKVHLVTEFRRLWRRLEQLYAHNCWTVPVPFFKILPST
jgi:hypothetical protein